MASQGPNYPSSASIVSAGTVQWGNPQFATGAPNAQYAVAAGVFAEMTDILLLGPSGLGFSIPANATITGVEVRVRQQNSTF